MTHFQLRVPDTNPKNIELWLSVVPAGKRAAVWQRFHVYEPVEQYPLGTDRFVTNRRNLFVDILHLIEENARINEERDAEAFALASDGAADEDVKHSFASVRTLAQRAARAAADGSGNARRFKDARNLWTKITEHAHQSLEQSLTEPITKVHKTHNWKKNQPFKDVTVNPEAWFVLNVYSRSNPRKDPFVAARSLTALWDYMAQTAHGNDKVVSALDAQQTAAHANCDYPTYGEVAALVKDSNMLVFPDDQSFIEWVRQSAGNTDEVARDTLVDAYVVANPDIDVDDPAYMPSHSQGTVLHLANVVEKIYVNATEIKATEA
ncbi:hypothetical protein [Alloscardovia criceti]|uniref:hypothetical protein n=1 Tax=Alloscardovia criceti TaxID=356828 RepID=UPI0003612B06|nr:hypothetical protein [Alloscardovia criceti]